MAQITRVARNDRQKEIIKLFDGLQGSKNMWQLWSDFVVMIACTISNAVDHSHREEREITVFANIFALLVDAYERNADQDLLGELYMALGLGNDNSGQFFTPYDVCRCMSEISWGNATGQIEQKGWMAVNDPVAGAGALLIAFANTCRRHNINYQQSVLFVAQEIDFTTACMCYIQLSLLGYPGYVYVGNTLTDPCTSIDGRALIPVKPDNCWFMPMYFHNTWTIRRMIEQMRLMENQFRNEPMESKIAENDSIPAAETATAPFVQEPERDKMAKPDKKPQKEKGNSDQPDNVSVEKPTTAKRGKKKPAIPEKKKTAEAPKVALEDKSAPKPKREPRRKVKQESPDDDLIQLTLF